MYKAGQSYRHTQAPTADSIGVLAAAWSGIRRYLDKQFSPTQMASTALLVVVSYFLYARIAGASSFGYEIAVCAVTVILVFLQMRLIEDVDIHWSGGELLGQLGRRRPDTYRGQARIVLPDGRIVPRPPTLWGATAATTGAIIALNAPLGGAALTAALASTCLLILAYGALRLRALPRIVGLLAAFEVVPVLAYTYIYFAWRARTGISLSPADVIAVVGTFWAGWEFWKFSRGVGKYEIERAYGLTPGPTCIASLGFAALALAFQVSLWSRADLSVLYLALMAALTALVGLGVGATLRSLRRVGRVEGGIPPWAGLAYPAAVLAALGVQLVALQL